MMSIVAAVKRSRYPDSSAGGAFESDCWAVDSAGGGGGGTTPVSMLPPCAGTETTTATARIAAQSKALMFFT